MNPLDLAVREAQERTAERETDELLANEEGKFHIDERTVVDFEQKDIVIDCTGILGKGGFTDGVFKGSFKPPSMDICIPIAVKLMTIYDRQTRSNDLRGLTERTHETKVFRKVTNHKNVVALYGFVNHEMSFYMCMELMDASLLEVRQIVYDSARGERMAKQQIEQFLGCVTVSVVDALAFFRNEARVIHGDLKPGNVLLNGRGEVKLCDFGVSKKLQTAVTKTRAATNAVGTCSYMAPERFDSKTYGISRGYGSKSEVWSLGIMLIELATGVHPFDGISDNFVSDVITDASQQPPRLADDGYSIKMRTFISSCLFKSEKDRPSVLPYAVGETTKNELPEETNNVQSRNFYTFNARRAQSERTACVKEVLDLIRDGLPLIRSKIK